MSQPNLATQNKFPSVSSIHSMVSLGYLPPGHGYIPKKQKPDKPYGPSYITIMNRTWRGPGRKYLKYALVCFCVSLFFYIAAALYFSHRNVCRMIVRHSEPTGACLVIVAICLTTLMIQLIYKARMESNRWRSFVRFQAEGLFHVAPVNEEYSPKDPTKLETGTYGPRAVKEIPKPRYMNKRSKPGSRAGGRRARGAPMTTLMEGDEALPPVEEVEREMGSQDFLDMAGAPPYNGNRGPQQFKAEPLPQVHKPQPRRPNLEGQLFDEPIGEAPQVPIERLPQKIALQERMPPQARMTPVPQERMAPGMRYTPEPRMAPAIERMPAGARQTPQPRMTPGVRQTPEPRMTPGSRNTPSLTQPPERMTPGVRQTPEPRMIPGQGRTNTPTPRMIPGQGRPAAGTGRATPRGVNLQGMPRGAAESDL